MRKSPRPPPSPRQSRSKNKLDSVLSVLLQRMVWLGSLKNLPQGSRKRMERMGKRRKILSKRSLLVFQLPK